MKITGSCTAAVSMSKLCIYFVFLLLPTTTLFPAVTLANSFSLSGGEFEAILKSELGKADLGGEGKGGTKIGEDPNALLQLIIRDKDNDEMIEINNSDGEEVKKVRVKDLKTYLERQNKLLGGMQKGEDGSIYKEESGKLSIDEINKGGDKNLKVFMTLGRVGHQMMLRQGYGYPVISNLVSSPRGIEAMEDKEGPFGIPTMLVITTRDDKNSNTGKVKEKSFELEFELDENKYEYPGFAIINAWEVDAGSELKRIKKIEGLTLPPPPQRVFGYKLTEIDELIRNAKILGISMIVFGALSLFLSSKNSKAGQKND